VSATPNNSDNQMAQRVIAENAALEQALASVPVRPPAAPGQPQTIEVPAIDQAQSLGPMPGYLPTYFPGTAVPASASVITVDAGEEHGGTDIRVQLIEASLIQGTVMNPASQTTAVQVSLQNEDPSAESQGMTSTRANNDGRFTFPTVAPGKYTLLAQTVPAPQQMLGRGSGPVPQPRLSDEEKLWGRAQVTVEGQSTINVSLTLQPGRSISGMVMFDTVSQPNLAQKQITVNVNPAPSAQMMPMFSGPPQAPVGADGRFTLAGVIPGKYVLRASAFFTKSAMVGGEDLLDFPLDFTGEHDVSDVVITVTDRPTELSGVLTDASGKPATDYTVLLASRDSRYWTPGSRRIVTSRAGPDGRYTFRSMPPGDYLLAALTDLEPGSQYDPEVLKSLVGASMNVKVNEGAKQTQDIRLAK
jgi:5-hydroxyisourate hydrolase-like protein (transthyretin family)